MNKDNHLIFESFVNAKGDVHVHRPAFAEEINVAKADLNKDDQLSDYELARAKAMDKAMHKDEEAESKFTSRGAVNDIVVSELHKMHTALNQMSNMIDLNPSAEVDQLLCKIRDVADMLIAEHPAENEESADEKKERVQRGWNLNKKRWAKWKMENPEAAAKHAAKKQGKSENAEETAEQRIAAVKQAVAQAKGQIAQAKTQGHMKHYGDGMAQALGKSENAEHAPHGYPQGITAIQNLLINQLKKHGFTLTKISHADNQRDAYPVVFMMRSRGPMHNVAEIDGMGQINDEPYADYLKNLKHDAEEAEARSNAQHAAIAIALQKAGKKPS